MTITIRIATAGKQASLCMSGLRRTVAESINIDNSPNAERLSDMLNVEFVRVGSTDSPVCQVIGATIFEQFIKYMKGRDGVSEVKDSHEDGSLKGSELRMKKGKFAYCRIYALDNADGKVVVRVRYDNPKKVVGSIDAGIRTFAVALCRNALSVAEQYNAANNGITVEVKDYEGCEGILAKARDVNERLKLLRMRDTCPHRLKSGDFCVALSDGTPPKFGCELHCNGKCREVKEV